PRHAMKRAVLFVIVIGAAAISARRLGAHPMGNFSVNRYARLEPTAAGLRLLYIVDFAEIPAFQEVSGIPSLAALRDPSELEASPGARTLAGSLSRSWTDGIRVTEDGAELPLRRISSVLHFAPGVG